MSKLKLSDAVDIISGGTPSTTNNEYWENGEIGWLSVTDFNNDFRYVYDSEKKITAKGLKNSSASLLNKTDVVISARGTVGALAQVGVPMSFNQSCFGLRGKEKIIGNTYLYYYLKNYVANIIKRSQGSVFSTINLRSFDLMEIDIPDIPVQEKVASILSLIDDKIEINNCINLELEAMAKTLYNYWFVQFDFPNDNGEPYKTSGGKMIYNEALKREIPATWEQLTLSDIITRSGTGLNPRNNFKLGCGKNFYITIRNIKDGKILFSKNSDRIDDDALKIINERSDLRPGDVLFTSIEPVGVTYLLHETPKDWNINESVFTIRANTEKITPEYLFMLLSSVEMRLFTRNSSAGSIHKGIRHGVLKAFRLPYAGKSLVDLFSMRISPLLKKMNLVDKENRELTELRDWLLPMLMNGQVTVK